jgi:hypothetical protein
MSGIARHLRVWAQPGAATAKREMGNVGTVSPLLADRRRCTMCQTASWATSRVDAATGDRDDVQSAVELAVAAAVQPVAIMSAGGHGDRCDSGDPGELRIALEALGAGGLADQYRGA